MFLLIETKGEDLFGTIEALRNKDTIQQYEAYKKEHDNAGYFDND
jgi:hypothetical protein